MSLTTVYQTQCRSQLAEIAKSAAASDAQNYFGTNDQTITGTNTPAPPHTHTQRTFVHSILILFKPKVSRLGKIFI